MNQNREAMAAFAATLAAGMAPSPVERNREVPTRLSEPTATQPSRSIIVIDGGGRLLEEGSGVARERYQIEAVVRIVVATFSPDQVADALDDAFERVQRIIEGDRRLGLELGGVVLDTTLIEWDRTIFQASAAQGASPGGSIDALYALTVQRLVPVESAA